MADSILRDKSKEFAKKTVLLCRDMKSTHKESVLINQLLRSATSIGANLHEAQYAQGNKDFISILNSPEKAEALKEPLANSPGLKVPQNKIKHCKCGRTPQAVSFFLSPFQCWTTYLILYPDYWLSHRWCFIRL